jgi:hypothetical protein
MSRLWLAIARDIVARTATIVLAEAEGGGTRAVVTLSGTEGVGRRNHGPFGIRPFRQTTGGSSPDRHLARSHVDVSTL